jgi:hypothetical protein
MDQSMYAQQQVLHLRANRFRVLARFTQSFAGLKMAVYGMNRQLQESKTRW